MPWPNGIRANINRGDILHGRKKKRWDHGVVNGSDLDLVRQFSNITPAMTAPKARKTHAQKKQSIKSIVLGLSANAFLFH